MHRQALQARLAALLQQAIQVAIGGAIGHLARRSQYRSHRGVGQKQRLGIAATRQLQSAGPDRLCCCHRRTALGRLLSEQAIVDHACGMHHRRQRPAQPSHQGLHLGWIAHIHLPYHHLRPQLLQGRQRLPLPEVRLAAAHQGEVAGSLAHQPTGRCQPQGPHSTADQDGAGSEVLAAAQQLPQRKRGRTH